jgi:ATP-dependent helicase/nuclease subunit A
MAKRKVSSANSSSDTTQVSATGRSRAALEVESPPRHWIIRASAGSGKTFQLSNHYIARLRESSPDRILATTFTRKAAGEILERILLRLARAGLSDDGLNSLAPFVGEPALTKEEALRLLQQMTQSLHRLRIGTLDSFFSKLAGSFTLELGFPPGWQMLEDQEAQQLQTQAVEAMLRAETPQDVVLLMNRLAKGAVVQSIERLIDNAISNHYYTFLATTDLAWEPFPLARFVVSADLEAAIQALAALTFDNSRHQKARDEDIARARDEQWEEFLQKGLAGKLVSGETEYYRKPITDEVQALYGPLLDHARAKMIVPWAEQNKATRALLNRFHAAYEQLKLETRGFRFDDIARRLSQRLTDRSAESMEYRLDCGIDHLLLDEFQDTSPVQWGVLRPFARSVVSGHGTSFFCVGDTKQAIYGWRGGLAALFDAIEEELPGVHRRPLDESFRSSPLIIETVNKIFEGLTKHPGLDRCEAAVTVFSENFPKHATARKHLAGHVRLECPPTADPDGKGTEDELLEFAAARIKNLAERHPHASIGVLVRTNKTVGKMVYRLQQKQVDASEEGGSPLTDSAAVQLILSLLTLADHPGHAISRFHLANSPLAAWLEYTDHRDDAGANRVADRIRNQLLQHGYSRTLYAVALELMPHSGPRDARRLRQLVDMAAGYDALATLRPRDFVQYVQTQKVQDPTEAQVRVMNIHQAKGLEFDIVVLPELDERLRPVTPSHVYRIPSATEPPDCVMIYRDQSHVAMLPGHLQAVFAETLSREVTEALCILYVMLTRAVHSLHMIVAPNPTEKKLPLTFAGLIRAALTDGKLALAGTLLYEEGDPTWTKDRSNKECNDVADAASIRTDAGSVGHDSDPYVEPRPIKFAPMPDGRRRGRERVSPSRAKDRHASTVKLSSVLTLGTAETLDRGTLVHAWCERIRWIDDGLPTDETLHEVSRRLQADAARANRALKEFHDQLRAPDIQSLLSRKFYEAPASLPLPAEVTAQLQAGPVEFDVATERKIAVIDGGEFISGSIDRLVLIRRGGQVIAADVIDFKTDYLPPHDPQAIPNKVAAYRDQLRLYRRAVAKIYALPETAVMTRLVLLDAGTVATV